MLAETDRERTMMSQPNRWPLCPILPVKRFTGVRAGDFPKLGVMLAVEGQFTTVFLLGLFSFPKGPLKTVIDNPEIKRIVYASLDDLLAAGWIVD